jgi:hypothetical protein
MATDQRTHVVGVTGTRRGATQAQRLTIEDFLRRQMNLDLPADTTYWLAYGQCNGVDAQVAMIAQRLGYKLAAFPGHQRDGRSPSRCTTPTPDYCFPEAPYLVRDAEIVRRSAILLVVPHGPEEIRSGTWTTCRIARRTNHPYLVIRPDGSHAQ